MMPQQYWTAMALIGPVVVLAIVLIWRAPLTPTQSFLVATISAGGVVVLLAALIAGLLAA